MERARSERELADAMTKMFIPRVLSLTQALGGPWKLTLYICHSLHDKLENVACPITWEREVEHENGRELADMRLLSEILALRNWSYFEKFTYLAS